MDFILASASPRRAELLCQLGLSFKIHAADIDETLNTHEKALDYVLRMARTKGQVVSEHYPPEAVVIAADTVVCLEQTIMGKPKNQSDSESMLMQLSAQTHNVHTALVVIYQNDLRHCICSSEVTFRALTPLEIERYWQTGEPIDKAGSYAIQGQAARFIQHLTGSYSGVMGLPLYELDQLLKPVLMAAENK